MTPSHKHAVTVLQADSLYGYKGFVPIFLNIYLCFLRRFELEGMSGQVRIVLPSTRAAVGLHSLAGSENWAEQEENRFPK